jgi:hypothetical protein
MIVLEAKKANVLPVNLDSVSEMETVRFTSYGYRTGLIPCTHQEYYTYKYEDGLSHRNRNGGLLNSPYGMFFVVVNDACPLTTTWRRPDDSWKKFSTKAT